MKKHRYASTSWFKARCMWLSVLLFRLAYPTFTKSNFYKAARYPYYFVDWEEYDDLTSA